LLGVLGLLLAGLDYFDLGRRFNALATAFFRKAAVQAFDILTLGRTDLNPGKTCFHLNAGICASVFVLIAGGMVYQALKPVHLRSDGFTALSWFEIPLLILIWPLVVLIVISMMQGFTLGIAELIFNFRRMTIGKKLLMIVLSPVWVAYFLLSAPYALGSSVLFGALAGLGYLLSLPPKGFLATAGLFIAVVSVVATALT
jgi:hypothetical protein